MSCQKGNWKKNMEHRDYYRQTCPETEKQDEGEGDHCPVMCCGRQIGPAKRQDQKFLIKWGRAKGLKMEVDWGNAKGRRNAVGAGRGS